MSSDFRERLQRFEADPPPAVWDRVAGALDPSPDYAQRLQRYEATPPLGLWERIQEGLANTASQAPVRTLTPNRSRRRVAALAAVMAAAVVILFIVRQPSSTAVQVPPASDGSAVQQAGVVPFSRPSENDIASSSSPSRNELKKPEATARRRGALLPRLSLRKSPLRNSFLPQQANAERVVTPNASDFVVYSDDAGMVMRLPRKAYPLLACADGDNSCRERVRRLQGRLAGGSMAADFTAVLDLLQRLQ